MKVTEIWNEETRQLLDLEEQLSDLGFLQSAIRAFYCYDDEDAAVDEPHWQLMTDLPDKPVREVALTGTEYWVRISLDKFSESMFISDLDGTFEIQYIFRCVPNGESRFGNEQWRQVYRLENVRGDMQGLKRMMALAKLLR